MRKLYFLVAIAGSAAAYPVFGQSAPAEPSIPAIADHSAARFLDQATWGPTIASIAQVQQMGIPAWLQAQFALNTSDLPDQAILASNGNPNENLLPVESALIQNAVNQPDQLRQRVALALSEIWVVSAENGVPNAYAYPPYWRIFRDNAFGNYRDIIQAVSLSPAMGRYLNMANNNKGNPAKGTAANENYARELMQLFTIGLTQLNPDGSPVLDSSGNPVTTYAQAQVTDTARALTGWTYPTAPGATAKNNNPAYYFGQMFAVAAEHDTTSKTIINNTVIPAGQTAAEDLNSVIDTLMAQNTMAPFVSRQLIEHLVTSNPSPAYIERVSNVFLNNGKGVRGDMQAVITAILTDTEARAGDNPTVTYSANFGHLREPVLLVANVLRGLNATVGPTNTLYNYTTNMGQNLFNAGSVFSYFPPQYQIATGVNGPEFQIYSTQTVSTRANFVNSAVYGTVDSTTKVNLAPFIEYAANTNTLLEYVSYVFLHHSMSDALYQAATAAVNAAGTSAQARAQAALYIVLTSGEYQIVH